MVALPAHGYCELQRGDRRQVRMRLTVQRLVLQRHRGPGLDRSIFHFLQAQHLLVRSRAATVFLVSET